MWWDSIVKQGPYFGYFANPPKTWLIVKEELLQQAIDLFNGTGVNITVRGKRHLGAALGSIDYRTEFVSELVAEWIEQIGTLSVFAKSDPHAAYTVFTKSLRHRYTYFMRTIPDIAVQLEPLEHAIRTQLIPALTEGQLVNDHERQLLSLPVRYGGLGLINPCEMSDTEFENSVKLTAELASKIVGRPLVANTEDADERIGMRREQHHKDTLEVIRMNISDSQCKLNEISQMKGASSWLSVMPVTEHGFWLAKREFWDAIRLRYDWPLTHTPSHCACGESFNTTHALSCHLGGFITLRHNELRDFTAELLAEVCNDVKTEPALEPLTGEAFSHRTANLSNEARVDVSARGLWRPYQKAFLDIRVFNPLAKRYGSVEKAFVTHQKEKKRVYGRRVLEVENGTFTPMVFSIIGGLGKECDTTYKRIGQLLADKRKTSYNECMTFIRTKIYFAIIRSALRCIRGSRKWNVDRDHVRNEDISDVAASCN